MRSSNPLLDDDITSDHTYQSVDVRFVEADERPIFSLSGSTWNLMNYCISKEKRFKTSNGKQNFKNNPWNIDESPKQYFDRKKRQFEKIIGIIQSGGKDFMLLQEIDCLSSTGLLRGEDKSNFIAMREKVFFKKLKSLGWDIEMTTRETGTKPNAILYNKKTLQRTERRHEAVLDNAGFACEFQHTVSGKKVTLVDLHLDYTKDYSQSIPDYQARQVAANRFTVMGGDTNHSPNHKIVGLINNWHNITNLAGDDKTGLISGTASDGSTKCYDGFFVSPTTTTRADIIETRGEVFYHHDRRQTFLVRELDPSTEYPKHCAHKTVVGMAWKRGAWTEHQASSKAPGTKTPTLPVAKQRSAAQSNSSFFASTPAQQKPYFKFFQLDFNKLNNDQQADAILYEIQVSKGPVGITYSANHQQTEALYAYYNKPNDANWQNLAKQFTGSSNQGDVMRILLNKLKNHSNPTLMGKFQILPISTMTYDRNGMAPSNFNWLQGNLENINHFISKGGYVLGWQNQLSKNPRECAIGGGVAGQVFNREMSQYVQNHLTAIADASDRGQRPPAVQPYRAPAAKAPAASSRKTREYSEPHTAAPPYSAKATTDTTAPTQQPRKPAKEARLYRPSPAQPAQDSMTELLIERIRAHLLILKEPAFINKTRKQHKINVLECALKCLQGKSTQQDLSKTKLDNPEWSKATGKSKVKEMVDAVERALDQPSSLSTIISSTSRRY